VGTGVQSISHKNGLIFLKGKYFPENKSFSKKRSSLFTWGSWCSISFLWDERWVHGQCFF